MDHRKSEERTKERQKKSSRHSLTPQETGGLKRRTSRGSPCCLRRRCCPACCWCSFRCSCESQRSWCRSTTSGRFPESVVVQAEERQKKEKGHHWKKWLGSLTRTKKCDEPSWSSTPWNIASPFASRPWIPWEKRDNDCEGCGQLLNGGCFFQQGGGRSPFSLLGFESQHLLKALDGILWIFFLQSWGDQSRKRKEQKV